jgi:hypothetical protein
MATSFRNYSLDLHDQTLGQAHFRCVALHQLVQDNPVFVGVKPGMYCFEVDKPALRVKITSDFVYQALYNDLHLFQNHYIADNIRITRNSEPLLNIHVENIESLTTVQDADFMLQPTRFSRISNPAGLWVLWIPDQFCAETHPYIP